MLKQESEGEINIKKPGVPANIYNLSMFERFNNKTGIRNYTSYALYCYYNIVRV